LTQKSLFNVVEEQINVGFTGKVNVLDDNTKQIYGYVVLHEGEVLKAMFKQVTGLKGLYNLLIEEQEHQNLDYVVEPELVQKESREIHFPFSIIKKRAEEVLAKYAEGKSNRPPNSLKLTVNPDFINVGEDVTGEEYDLLCTISDFNRVEDIYKNCPLLDYEITNALVSLRKKKALKVIKVEA
jgi:hypothetical protein